MRRSSGGCATSVPRSWSRTTGRSSQQLDGLLQERLDQLSAAAESADGLPPVQAKALLESIESGGRQTLDDMREIVGLLRGGDVAQRPPRRSPTSTACWRGSSRRTRDSP